MSKIIRYLQKAAAKGADLLILPELADSGYYIKENIKSLSLSSPLIQVLQDTVDEKEIILCAPFTEEHKGKLYNSIYKLSPQSEPVIAYRKTHLFPGEATLFEKGEELQLSPIDEFTTAFHICYDLRFPELTRKARRNGAELLIIPAAWPKARIEQWKILLQARAVENQMYVIAVNRCGTDLDLTFGGHSMVVAPDGHIVEEAEEKEELLIVDIHVKSVEALRKRYPFFDDCREELY